MVDRPPPHLRWAQLRAIVGQSKSGRLRFYRGLDLGPRSLREHHGSRFYCGSVPVGHGAVRRRGRVSRGQKGVGGGRGGRGVRTGGIAPSWGWRALPQLEVVFVAAFRRRTPMGRLKTPAKAPGSGTRGAAAVSLHLCVAEEAGSGFLRRTSTSASATVAAPSPPPGFFRNSMFFGQ